MDWPYHINTDLTPAQKAVRRQTLDRYGLYAHLSTLLPIAVYWLYVLTVWVSRARQARGDYAAVPGSPHGKRGAGTAAGRAARWWRWGVFLVGGSGRGDQGQVRVVHRLVGVAWAAWLGFLTVHGTGDGELGSFLMSLVGQHSVGRPLNQLRGSVFIVICWVVIFEACLLFCLYHWPPILLFPLVHDILGLEAKAMQTTSTSPSASEQSQHLSSQCSTFS